jgi:hypothetical protein
MCVEQSGITYCITKDLIRKKTIEARRRWFQNRNETIIDINDDNDDNDDDNKKKNQLQTTRFINYGSVCTASNCIVGDCEILSLTTYICHCNQGISGGLCNIPNVNGDPCISKPCWGTGSLCINLSSFNIQQLPYLCACSPGRGGKDCQGYINNCRCQNGGTCISDRGVNICTCPNGYG